MLHDTLYEHCAYMPYDTLYEHCAYMPYDTLYEHCAYMPYDTLYEHCAYMPYDALQRSRDTEHYREELQAREHRLSSIARDTVGAG